jgi:hypothetical protein
MGELTRLVDDVLEPARYAAEFPRNLGQYGSIIAASNRIVSPRFYCNVPQPRVD